MNADRVDIIIRGAGLAGTSLMLALVEQGYTGKILVVDKLPKPDTQKTWCFWGDQNLPDSLRALIAKRWLTWSFSSDDEEFEHKTSSLDESYCCIKAEDFYQYALSKLTKTSNIEWHWNTDCEQLDSDDTAYEEGVAIMLNGKRVSADLGFDSAGQCTAPDAALNKVPNKAPNTSIINQYFSGAWVTSASPIFDSNNAALMKNMVADNHCFEFTYILPFNAHSALIELTRFSTRQESLSDMQSACEQIIADGKYGTNISTETTIERWEKGVLPMDTRIKPVKVGNWESIGVKGNMIRASSGYAFMIIQRWAKYAAAVIGNNAIHCENSGAKDTHRQQIVFTKSAVPSLYTKLDSVFLKVMRNDMARAPQLFSAMAQHIEAGAFARFMSESASFKDMLAMINAMPKRPFLRALITPEH
ncbi:hypothetical protein CW735_07690 [Alteromonas sp. MB-3u-76]|jgi:lycopene beta-cyclase|uniref:lycopene cyclase family protein n=1 Tax=Alteromonas sp. MB-3u-76 TaxID=2058133 RepID=UPI000C30FE86|nr:lycopene cyclase family protein [Alteromonas sp. MB-3u-76]AUC88086.1 hypothetical protein CW735_07690 [Alteromonas sp. MB-3u-76]